MLKTALAYVVVRARQKKRAQEQPQASARLTARSGSTTVTMTNDTGVGKRARQIAPDAPADDSTSVVASPPSALDRLLQGGATTSGSKKRSVRTNRFSSSSTVSGSTFSIDEVASSLLRREKGSTHHLDHTFKIACSLAKAVLMHRNPRNGRSQDAGIHNGDDGSAALLGATTHLTQQLKALLAVEQQVIVKDSRSSQSTFRGGGRSGSTGNTITTRMSESKKAKATTVVVTPNTTAPQSQQSTSTPNSQTITSTSASTTTTRTDENSAPKNHSLLTMTVGKWILATLKASADVDDVRATFFVYQVMISQALLDCPPIIGHIFLVAVNIIRELYDDQLFVRLDSASSTTNTQSHIQQNKEKALTLNVLAVETLRLLEACWMAEVSPDAEKEHRAFLLLTLQEILGDLLIPLPLSGVAQAYGQRAQQAANLIKQKRHQQRLAASERKMSSRPGKGSSHGGIHRSLSTFTVPSSVQYLDPGAKLIMRIGICRLLTLQ